MESAEKAFNTFPIEMIFFIIVIGLFVVLSFPFDLPSMYSKSPVIVSSYNGISFHNLSNYLDEGFHPFVNVNLLSGGNFLTGAGILILCSLPVGVLLFLLYSIYEMINHLPKLIICKFKKKKYKTKSDRIKEKGICPVV